MDKKKVSIILGIVCIFLTFAIVVQMNTVKKTISTTDPTFTENELRDEVLKWKEKYDDCFSDLGKAEIRLEEVRSKATQNDTSMQDKQEELKIDKAYLGLTDVSGKGITITLKDSQTVTSETIGLGENLSEYIIHDIDILGIINELKNIGAEAISINDQRWIPTSSVICTGAVAQINGEKIGAPFVIKAIGLQDAMYENLKRPGGYVAALQDDGIEVDIKKSNANMTISKYNGVINFKYAKTIK